jgi:murein DD-endopeptidase MepM/ murein hydrolase activator NlpD
MTVCRNVFRLTAVLYLVFLLKPGYAAKQQENPPVEHGIGGGVLFVEDTFKEVLSAEEAGIVLSPASVESVMELGSFFKPRVMLYDSHTVKSGDHISELAVSYGLTQDTIISINKITNTRLLQIGRVLKIPNQDGVLHTVKNGETLSSIAERYKSDQETIITVNELFSENIRAGTDIFIPGARLDWIVLQEINGDLFIWPVSGVITSAYGNRRDPFNHGRSQFHTGIDIRGGTGTPVRAAMSGRISQVGYDPIWGNYVIISHHSGYRTLYAHLSVIRTRTGAYISTGERIGDIGSTGLSTGPHLHFTVYKNGVTVNPRSLMR